MKSDPSLISDRNIEAVLPCQYQCEGCELFSALGLYCQNSWPRRTTESERKIIPSNKLFHNNDQWPTKQNGLVQPTIAAEWSKSVIRYQWRNIVCTTSYSHRMPLHSVVHRVFLNFFQCIGLSCPVSRYRSRPFSLFLFTFYRFDKFTICSIRMFSVGTYWVIHGVDVM